MAEKWFIPSPKPGWYWVILPFEGVDSPIPARWDGETWECAGTKRPISAIARVGEAIPEPSLGEDGGLLGRLCNKNPDNEHGESEYAVLIAGEFWRAPDEIEENCRLEEGGPVYVYKLVQSGIIEIPEAPPKLVPFESKGS